MCERRKTPESRPRPADLRKERLKDALRENLRRRKQQARARADAADDEREQP